MKDDLQKIKLDLQKFYVYTGECDELEIEANSSIGVELLTLELDQRQSFLDKNNSGLRIVKNDPDSIIVELKNVNCQDSW